VLTVWQAPEESPLATALLGPMRNHMIFPSIERKDVVNSTCTTQSPGLHLGNSTGPPRSMNVDPVCQQRTQILTTISGSITEESAVTSTNIVSTTSYLPVISQIVSSLVTHNSNGVPTTIAATIAVTNLVPRPTYLATTQTNTEKKIVVISSATRVEATPSLVTYPWVVPLKK
jgi:hypothetical protein